MGHEQLNNLVSAMNIPTVNHHTIKRAEARVGPAFEECAKQSMRAALLEEKRLTEEFNRYVHSKVEHFKVSVLVIDHVVLLLSSASRLEEERMPGLVPDCVSLFPSVACPLFLTILCFLKPSFFSITLQPCSF